MGQVRSAFSASFVALWSAEATPRGIAESAHFVSGLQDDLSAITAGLTLEWNNGVIEGQIHRLKFVKGQGCGGPAWACEGDACCRRPREPWKDRWNRRDRVSEAAGIKGP